MTVNPPLIKQSTIQIKQIKQTRSIWSYIFIKFGTNDEYGYTGKHELFHTAYFVLAIMLPFVIAAPNATSEVPFMLSAIQVLAWYWCLSSVYWNYKCEDMRDSVSPPQT
jgi:hypothetical protein